MKEKFLYHMNQEIYHTRYNDPLTLCRCILQDFLILFKLSYFSKKIPFGLNVVKLISYLRWKSCWYCSKLIDVVEEFLIENSDRNTSISELEGIDNTCVALKLNDDVHNLLQGTSGTSNYYHIFSVPSRTFPSPILPNSFPITATTSLRLVILLWVIALHLLHSTFPAYLNTSRTNLTHLPHP